MVYLVTYGCKVNYWESEAVATLLDRVGVANQMLNDGAIARVPDGDVFVVNSCAVTSMAEKKSRYGIAKIKKYHPHALIVTMGCALGRKSPEQVATDVCAGLAGGGVARSVGTPTTVQHRREKAFIKVQDGCRNFCNYCIIPYRRNTLGHRTPADVVAEINAQGAHVTEIVLCGINLCYYPNFAELCRAVDACGRAWRISSLEPPLITPELIATWRACRHFVPAFHICLQAGDDGVLRDMNRHYTTADYARIIDALRTAFPDGSFATDVIVGYPTETDDAFERTYQFLQNLRLDKLHIFPFSPRAGTPAAQLKPLTNAVVTARVARLDELNHR